MHATDSLWLRTGGLSGATLGFALVVMLGLAGCATRDQATVSAPAKPATVTAQPEPTPPPPAPPPPVTSASPAKKAANAPSLDSPGWQELFDGKTLAGWKTSDFAGSGEVRAEDGKIVLGMGVMTGVTCTNPIPRMNYEVSLEAMRVDGSDFFCGLTFPVGKDPCSLIVGGWGGGVVGLSSLDGEDAANNETTHYMNFEKGRWYWIRLRVKPDAIQAWIDEEKVVDVVTTDRKISIRLEVEASVPFGIATWATSGAIRNIQVRPL